MCGKKGAVLEMRCWQPQNELLDGKVPGITPGWLALNKFGNRLLIIYHKSVKNLSQICQKFITNLSKLYHKSGYSKATNGQQFITFLANVFSTWRVFRYRNSLRKTVTEINWQRSYNNPFRTVRVPWPAKFAPKNCHKGHQRVFILWLDSWTNMWQNFEQK